MKDAPDDDVARKRWANEPPLGQSIADAPSQLRDRLAPGERLIWWDRAAAWQFTIRPLTYLLVAAGFACFGLWAVIDAIAHGSLFGPSDTSSSYVVFGLFLACAIGGLIGVYFGLRNIANRHNVAYGLTDRRLIIAIGRWKAKSFDATAFRNIWRLGKRRGTIWFDFGPDGEGPGYRHALYGIADAPGVERLLHEQFNMPKKKKSFWRPFG
jgi:hypothetical protein